MVSPPNITRTRRGESSKYRVCGWSTPVSKLKVPLLRSPNGPVSTVSAIAHTLLSRRPERTGACVSCDVYITPVPERRSKRTSPQHPDSICARARRGRRRNAQSSVGGGPERDNPRSRATLQRPHPGRHTVAHYHAGLLDRLGWDARMDLPRPSSLHRLLLCPRQSRAFLRSIER